LPYFNSDSTNAKYSLERLSREEKAKVTFKVKSNSLMAWRI
jgi:hypothetical protein